MPGPHIESLDHFGGWNEMDDDELLDPEYDLDSTDKTLADIDKSLTINFPYKANYTTWKAHEAFRELVQNWRDSIIKSFNIPEDDFHVIREETVKGRNTEIVFKALRLNAEPKEWMGYIRFNGKDDMGTIEIMNRKATLQPWHLDMGGTSKENDSTQAGAHGEGLKLALLVLQRSPQNHRVRCVTGGFDWTFNFTTKGKLVARLRRMSPEKIGKVRDKNRNQIGKSLIPISAIPGEDVQFFIGESGQGRDMYGDLTRRSPVELAEFQDWTKIALFLQNVDDGGMVLHKGGNLITDERLRGNIYLKGLLLKESTPTRSASRSGKLLKYGYNFPGGVTNRERESVANTFDESRAIFSIWDRAIQVKGELIADLSDMLNSTDPLYADVNMEKNIKPKTVEALKLYLFGHAFAGKWFYSAEQRVRGSRLLKVIDGLGCEGMELTDSYWSLLRRNTAKPLIRTAKEEQQRRFQAADIVSVPETTFAEEVFRLIRACLKSCSQTEEMTVQFVKAGSLYLDSSYSQPDRLVKFHDRWVTMDDAKRELGLLDGVSELDVIYHTVKRLFNDVVSHIGEEAFEGDRTRSHSWNKKRELNQAEQRLINYTRIKTGFTIKASLRCLEVSSNGFETLQDIGVAVQLHRGSHCSLLKDALLAEEVESIPVSCYDFQAGVEPGEARPWRCREQQLSHCFEDVDGDEEYFALAYLSSDPKSFVVVSNNTCGVAPDPSTTSENTTIAAEPEQTTVSSEVNDFTGSPDHDSLPQDRQDSPDELPAPVVRWSPLPSKRSSKKLRASKVAPPTSPASQPVANDQTENPNDDDEVQQRQSPANNPNSWSLGERLENLDSIFVPRDWYHATNDIGGEAVVGALRTGAQESEEEGRKRRRTRF